MASSLAFLFSAACATFAAFAAAFSAALAAAFSVAAVLGLFSPLLLLRRLAPPPLFFLLAPERLHTAQLRRHCRSRREDYQTPQRRRREDYQAPQRNRFRPILDRTCCVRSMPA